MHRTPTRRMGRPRADHDHVLEVALLVADHTGDDEVVLAALLHDVIEDRQASPAEVETNMGPRVAHLVLTMTENEALSGYKKRKAEHRERVAAAGRNCSLIFVADKVSNARRMLRGEKKFDPKKVEHYRLTLDLMRDRYPDLALLAELERTLASVTSSMSSR